MSLREDFNLEKYSEEFIDKIIGYMMKKDPELNRYLTAEEIAEKEKCKIDDVNKILSRTAIVWNH